MNRILIPSLILSLCLWTAGCSKNGNNPVDQGDQKMTGAVAQIEPTRGGTARGTVRFEQRGDKVRVIADITGLKPNQKHAIHVHEGTECGEDASGVPGSKAGGHYNPQGHKHGLPTAPASERHAGDLGNLQADSSGRARLELTVDNITISGTKNPVLGHAIIIHEREDDGGQPVGNAGGRIGCGIIKAGFGR